MKSSKIVLAVASAALLSLFSIGNAEETSDKVDTVKCVVAGKEIKIADAKEVPYKKATVYVCCNGCKAKMEKDSKKYAAKANHQLVLTGQAKQVKCPIAGRPVNEDKTVKVEGVKVAFCCGGCEGKAKKAEGEELVALVFSDKAFEKGFEVKEKK